MYIPYYKTGKLDFKITGLQNGKENRGFAVISLYSEISRVSRLSIGTGLAKETTGTMHTTLEPIRKLLFIHL